VVELLDSAHEADRALLDQLEELEALVAVALCDRDDQAQVGLDHPLLRIEVAALDALGEIDLLAGREQPGLRDPVEEELKGVERGVRGGEGDGRAHMAREATGPP
jgi:hypothetical protein